MALVPASSLPPASVAIVGTVDVSDRAARLVGHVTVDNASIAVTGPLTAAELVALEPLAVTGPLTDAQLAARLPLTVNQGTSPWIVNGSGVTQPVSVASLPLPDGAADNKTLSEIALTAILQRERMDTE